MDTLVAYDCRHPDIQITSLSVLSPELCKDNVPSQPPSKEAYVQVIQQNVVYPVTYISCRIHRIMNIHYCGYHSDISYVVEDGIRDEIISISREECERLVVTKTYHTGFGQMISNIVINASSIFNVQLHGVNRKDGTCSSGSQFEYKGAIYKRATVQAIYHILVTTGLAEVSGADNKAHFAGGLTCSYDRREECILPYLGYTYLLEFSGSCQKRELSLIYTGSVQKLYDNRTQSSIYIKDGDDYMFAIEATGWSKKCGRKVITTPHASLFIVEISPGDELIKPTEAIASREVDISLYINTKLVFLDRHIGKAFTSIYNLFKKHQCEVERRTINNLLTLAFLSGSEFAYAYKQVAGYTAELRGEVIHIVKCIPVPVQHRVVTGCFAEIPVVYNNTDMYISPRNRIVMKKAHEVDCSPLMPVKYFLGKNWYTIYPHLSESKSPDSLSPSTVEDFSYKSPQGLVAGGLYTKETMEDFRETILFGAEREAITSTIARAYGGLPVNEQQGSIINLLAQREVLTLSDLLQNTVGVWYHRISDLGSAIFGLCMLYTIIAKSLNIVLALFENYRRFGISWKLSAGIVPNLSHHMVLRSYLPLVRYRKADIVPAPVMEDDGSHVIGSSCAAPVYPPLYPVINDPASVLNKT